MLPQFARHFCAAAFMAASLTSFLLIPQVGMAEDMSSQEGAMLQDEVRSLRDAVQHMQSLQSDSAPPGGGMSDSDSVSDRPVYMGDNSGASSRGDLTVQLMERVKTLEQHDRELHGALEQTNHDLSARIETLDKQLQDARFAARTRGMHSSSVSSEMPKAGSETARSAGASSALVLLHNARSELQKRNFSAARENAETYVNTVKGARKVEGKLLLAQALSGEKQYQQAAVTYYDAFNMAPHTITGPQALLGVTSSLMALGESKAACQALEKLRTEYPTPSSWVSRAVMLDSQKARCTKTEAGDS